MNYGKRRSLLGWAVGTGGLAAILLVGMFVYVANGPDDGSLFAGTWCEPGKIATICLRDWTAATAGWIAASVAAITFVGVLEQIRIGWTTYAEGVMYKLRVEQQGTSAALDLAKNAEEQAKNVLNALPASGGMSQPHYDHGKWFDPILRDEAQGARYAVKVRLSKLYKMGEEMERFTDHSITVEWSSVSARKKAEDLKKAAEAVSVQAIADGKSIALALERLS